MTAATTPIWAALLALSVACDTAASAYLKIASERLAGGGFFLAAAAGTLAFAPSIVLLGYALRAGPSYVASIGLWFVGSYAASALVGVLAFGDPFTARTAAGLIVASAAVILLLGP